MFAASKTASLSGYQIQRSLRFNSADSAYLNRTPASAGNRRTFTWSGWIKLSATGIQRVLSASSGSADDFLAFASDTLRFQITDSGGTPVGNLITTQVFRDYSSWYHIVVAVDTTQATASNRLKMYVNGVQVTDFSTATYPAQNTDTLALNTAVTHYLSSVGGTNRYLNGYMTEVNFIDGQALTPSSFGITNPDTGVWQPKAYTGTYGTNGFYLNFSDNSNTTATTLGKDYSGNGNNWTPNNFSVSAGAGNDSLVDVPTNWGTDTGVGGTVRGNYCTLNPLITPSSNATISNGNLSTSFSDWKSVFGTMPIPTSGKWYWEVTTSTSDATFGIVAAESNLMAARNIYFTGSVVSYGYYGASGAKYTGPSNTAASYGASFGNGDVIGVAFDADAGTLVFYKNNTSQGTAFTGLTSIYVPAFSQANGSCDCNFGQRPFAYTAPSGFKALCTQNLPTPTVGATASTQAGKYFNTVLYTGNSTNPRAISGFGFSPDYIVQARRDVGYGLQYFDIVRGAGKRLNSSSTAAEDTYNIVGSFDSDGFTITGNVDQGNNVSGGSYVAWGWDAGGAGVTNTAGSITSTVSANTTSGFSVVKWNGSGNATIGHGLGVAPSMYIVKLLNNTSQWYVYFRALGAGKYLQLNLTAAEINDTAIWQNTAPTSTVFSIGSGINANNMVAYCFAEVPGYSKFGSYTGNNSTDGPFAYCGFRPAWLLVKRTGNVAGWFMVDNKRNTYNLVNNYLYANATDAEAQYPIVDFLSNGFKVRMADTSMNAPGETYIFAAFAEAPQKFALAR